MRVSLQPAFILHHRPFRETSVLLDVFTEEYGRVSLIARGVRSSRSKLKAILQPFVSLLVSWQGKGELMNLVAVESKGVPLQLRGDCLLSGFYLNELLVRLLQKQDPYPSLFLKYKKTLEALAILPLNPKSLRLFEKSLLEEAGYGLQWYVDFSTGQPLVSDNYYRYYPGHGFKEMENGQFKGECLLEFANETLMTDESLRDAKRLMRMAIALALDNYALQSKDLFIR